MASILSINDDLLLEIVKYLQDKKSTLCALAFSHRIFYNVVRTMVVRNIEVWVQGSTDVGTKQYDQLIWTLESQPDLGLNTRSLRLKWGCDTPWHSIDKDAASDRAKRLIELTPNIRRLDIQNYSHKCSPFAPPLDLLLGLKELATIHTSDPRSTAHEVAQLMQVPNLQSLEIQFMDAWTTPKPQTTNNLETKTLASNLIELILPSGSHLNPPAVNSLLTVAPHIKSLSTNLPGLQPQEVPIRRRGQPGARMLEKLSPAGLLTCLRPAQETLIELKLIDVGVQWPDHDGSRFDLRGYTSLKKVSLPAGCVFVPDGPWDGRKGLEKYLPQTIEEITIDFNFSQGFLYKAAEIPSLFHDETDVRNVLSTIAPERYGWLTELVAHAASVPNLRHLTIKEQVKGSHGISFGQVIWDPPTALKAQFESRGWKVFVSVRVPKKHPSNISH